MVLVPQAAVGIHGSVENPRLLSTSGVSAQTHASLANPGTL